MRLQHVVKQQAALDAPDKSVDKGSAGVAARGLAAMHQLSLSPAGSLLAAASKPSWFHAASPPTCRHQLGFSRVGKPSIKKLSPQQAAGFSYLRLSASPSPRTNGVAGSICPYACEIIFVNAPVPMHLQVASATCT